MCNSFNFFLLTFFLKYFPGNMFYNGLCFAVADITAFAVAGCTINYTGVKQSLVLAYIIGLTGGVMYMMFSGIEFLIPIFVTLSRLGACMAYNTGYVSVNRLFPTRFQSTVYAVVNLVAHLVACVAPLIAEIPDPYPFSFYLGAMSIALFAQT